MKANSILMRIENIGDPFDSFTQSPSLQVDIQALAAQLFEEVNGDTSALVYIDIKETSLTGN